MIAGSNLLNYIQVEIYYVISRFFETVSLKSLMQRLLYVLIIQNDKLCCNIILIRISMHLDMIFTLIRMHTGILQGRRQRGGRGGGRRPNNFEKKKINIKNIT